MSMEEIMRRLSLLERDKTESPMQLRSSRSPLGSIDEQIKYGRQVVDTTRPAGHLTFTTKYIPIVIYSNCHNLLDEAAQAIVKYFDSENIQECFQTFPMFFTLDKRFHNERPTNVRAQLAKVCSMYHSLESVKRGYSNKLRPKTMAEIRYGGRFLVAVANLPSKYFWKKDVYTKISAVRENIEADLNIDFSIPEPDEALEEKDPEYITTALEEALSGFKREIKARAQQDGTMPMSIAPGYQTPYNQQMAYNPQDSYNQGINPNMNLGPGSLPQPYNPNMNLGPGSIPQPLIRKKKAIIDV